jgi:tetratricopeptide (TPR) repeat protein
MGSYILCQVRRAENPFFIESVSLNIYSIEELCFFICRNLPLLDESMFNETLADWLEEELHLRRLSQKLRQLFRNEFSLEEVIFPVLREIHYLNSAEFKELEASVRGLEEQPVPVRLKMKGDALVSHKKYIKAIEAYHSALVLQRGTSLGTQFLGTVENNMGCAYARLFQMEEACECFRTAYEQLHTLPTLKSYLYAVCLKDGEDAWERKADELGVDPSTREEMEREMTAIRPAETPEDLDAALAGWTREYHRNTGL